MAPGDRAEFVTALPRRFEKADPDLVYGEGVQKPLPQVALGEAIRELRHKRGASLETLAPKAGISLNMLSVIECGEANPTWNTVHGIAAALEISVSELAEAAEKLEK